MDSRYNENTNQERFSSSRKITTPNGWLSPAGVFVPCKPDEHGASADFIFAKNRAYFETHLQNEDLEKYARLPRYLLEKAGYILVSHGIYNKTSFEDLTPKQQEVLKNSKVNYEEAMASLSFSDKFKFFERFIKPNQDYLSQKGFNSSRLSYIESIELFSNPEKELFLIDKQDLAQEIYDNITADFPAEAGYRVQGTGNVFSDHGLAPKDAPGAVDEWLWRSPDPHPSDKSVFVELITHVHDGRSEGTMGNINSTICLVNFRHISNF